MKSLASLALLALLWGTHAFAKCDQKKTCDAGGKNCETSCAAPLKLAPLTTSSPLPLALRGLQSQPDSQVACRRAWVCNDYRDCHSETICQ